MAGRETNTALNRRKKEPVMSVIMDRHAEEIVSDEQLERVLSPVLEMIYEGEFERPHSEWFTKKRTD